MLETNKLIIIYIRTWTENYANFKNQEEKIKKITDMGFPSDKVKVVNILNKK